MLLILNQTRVGQLDVSDISQSMQTMPVTTLGRNGLMWGHSLNSFFTLIQEVVMIVALTHLSHRDGRRTDELCVPAEVE